MQLEIQTWSLERFKVSNRDLAVFIMWSKAENKTAKDKQKDEQAEDIHWETSS